MKRVVGVALLMTALVLGSVTCTTAADVASRNISKEAEQFKVFRRIVFINGITDNYILEIQGFCSVETSETLLTLLKGSLEVTCKVGPQAFKKHFLGLSANVSFLVEQIDPIDVSTSHYKVVFKPSVIVPTPASTTYGREGEHFVCERCI